MKKILMIGVTPAVGGIETYIMNVFRHLDRTKFELYFPHIENMAYQSEIEHLGGKLIYGLPRSRKHMLKYRAVWKRAFAENQFDAVYFNNCDIVSMDVLKMAQKAGVPIRIFHAHNSSNTKPLRLRHKISEKYNRKIVGKVATNLLACSENAGDFMFGGLPYISVNNGIDIRDYCFSADARDRKRAELGIANEKMILFVGRFTEIKNPIFALQLVTELHKQDERFCAFFCGDGVLMAEAKQFANENECTAFVHLLGSRNDLKELYQAADYLVMPSLFEGFPFVLVEAQCSGLKCICSENVERNTNLSGTIEYLPLSHGITVWAEKISAMEPNKDRSQYAQTIRDAGYDIQQTVSLIEGFFEGKNK